MRSLHCSGALSTAITATAFGVASLAAQPAREATTESFVDTIEVSVANVEVYVEDRKGEPIRGLGPQDFELSMDGESVPLSNFHEVDGGRRMLSEATGVDGEPEPERVSSSLIVYIDNANLSAFRRNRSLFKVRDFLRQRLERGDRAMVVAFGGALVVEQALTRSIDELTLALARVAEMSPVDEGPDARRRKAMESLVSLHLILAGAGGGLGDDPSMIESLPAVQRVAVQNLQDSLFQMADETGGRAVLNAGDLGPGLASVAGDLDTFYSLGYRFELQGERAHAIKVKVNRPGARVRIPMGKLVFLPSEGRHIGRLTVQVAARDRKGRLAPVRAVEVPLSIAADRIAEARGKVYIYEIKMLMREGDHSVAVGVSDEIGQQSSFVLAEVPVAVRVVETVN